MRAKLSVPVLSTRTAEPNPREEILLWDDRVETELAERETYCSSAVNHQKSYLDRVAIFSQRIH